MSDTPRTDAYVAMLIADGADADRLEHFARLLERQLNTVTENALALSQANAELRSRIRRLEEAGDAMAEGLPDDKWGELDKMKWMKAKEAKP